MLYAGSNLDNPQALPFSALDNSYNNNNNLAYPITPPYPTSTSSSAEEPGTSPDEYGYNDSNQYSTFTSPNSNFAAVKEEPISPNNFHVKEEPLSPLKASVSRVSSQNSKTSEKSKTSPKSQTKKLSNSQKLGNESKGNKVTKPKKEKTSHNMIEKRYRTNINDKILALRDCVPSLRCVVSGGPRPNEDLEGLTPASKLNKATVLTKATEYIMHLQKRNNMLMKELSEARKTRSSVDMPLISDSSTVTPSNPMPAYPQGRHPELPSNGSNYASKALMLSMAGIMGAGLMNDGSDMRGLSALPIFSFASSANLGPWSPQSLLFAFKIALIAGTVLYIIAPSLLDSHGPSTKNAKTQPSNQHLLDHNGNEFSLREMRKQSWFTNARYFTLPSETLSSHLVSFSKNIAQAFIINFMGSDGYDMMARVFDTEQLAVQRICLSRAIDAQLCGGDHGTDTRGRLFYTFVKSFILPATPSRYLTQAIHVSILCNGIRFLDVISSYVSGYFWAKARKGAAQEPVNSSDDDDHSTPKHIRALLNAFEGDSLDTTKRLYNVAFGLPVSYGCLTGENDEGYLSVVTDKSIRSIADVAAALYANSLVHEVLVSVLENDEIDFRKLELCSDIAPPCSIVGRRVAITEAFLLGPKDASYAKKAMDMLKEELDEQAWISHDVSNNLSPSSGHAIHLSHGQNVESDYDDDDTSSVSSANSMFDSETESINTEREGGVDFLSSAVKVNTTPFAVSQDSRLGIRCSLILCYLERNMNAHAFQLVQKVEINKLENICLLGFVAMWKVLCEMHDRKYTANRHKLEDLSAVARVWLGGNAGTKEGISLSRLRDLVGESVKMNKFFGGYDSELDEGYGTQ